MSLCEAIPQATNPHVANSKPWTAEDVPDLSGKTIIVTGSNSGIGFEAALQYARRHASTVMACRSLDKANSAAAQIRKAYPDAAVEVMELDLSSLASVRAFSEAFHQRHQRLDILCNNAGVMALPYRRTVDGFEMQFGTNHLGHFCLTGLLLPAILAAPRARVVVVSSGMHASGKIDFDNLDGKQSYRPWRAYSQSKLANLLFAYELQRRFTAASVDARAVGCHPG